MGFSVSNSMVRVDRFKAGGKWYDTLAVDMVEEFNNPSIHHALIKSITASTNTPEFVTNWFLQGGFFVCLEPYHKYAHPIVLK